MTHSDQQLKILCGGRLTKKTIGVAPLVAAISTLASAMTATSPEAIRRNSMAGGSTPSCQALVLTLTDRNR